jgi:hypothetical protein
MRIALLGTGVVGRTGRRAAEVIGSFGWPAGSLIDLGHISAARGREMVLPLWLWLMGTLGHADFYFHVPHA